MGALLGIHWEFPIHTVYTQSKERKYNFSEHYTSLALFGLISIIPSVYSFVGLETVAREEGQKSLTCLGELGKLYEENGQISLAMEKYEESVIQFLKVLDYSNSNKSDNSSAKDSSDKLFKFFETSQAFQ